MSISYERIVFAVIALAAAVLFGSTFSEEYDVPSFGGDVSTVFTPRLFLALIFLLALFLLATAKGAAAVEFSLGAAEATKLLTVAGVSLVVAFALPHAGFVAAAAPGMFLFCLLFGYRHWITLGLTSVLGPLAVWYLFNHLLELPLPVTPWISLS